MSQFNFQPLSRSVSEAQPADVCRQSEVQ